MADSSRVAQLPGGGGQVDVLEAVSEQDLRYLLACAGRMCLGDVVSPDDLVQEALARTIVGDRTWRDDVALRTQLVSTMKSVLSAWRKARGRSPEVQWQEAADGFVLDDGDGEMAHADPAYEVRLREQLEEVDAFLASDPAARDVMHGALAGYEGEELEIVTGLSADQIIAARKRIARKIGKREN